jgi:DNA polymerase III delta subunit
MTIPPGKSVFLVCGDDDFRVETTTRELLDALVPDDRREFGLEVIDGRVESLGEATRVFRAVRDALISDGLFGGGDKTVWLREPAFLSIDRIAKSEETKKNLATLTDTLKGGLPEGVSLVVSTLKINRGTTFFKAFGGKAGAVFDLGSGLRERDLRDQADLLLNEWLPKFGLDMKPAVRAAFLARVGTNSRQIVSELEKLSCWCGKRKTVTAEDIGEIVAADATSEVWDLSDAFAERDVTRTTTLLERHLDQGENAIFLTQTLLNTATTLLLLRDAQARRWASAGGRGVAWDGVPADIGECLDLSEKDIRKALFGWRAEKVARQAAAWTVAELRAARHQILTLREELVSKQLPERYMMETRLIQAMGTRKDVRRSR